MAQRLIGANNPMLGQEDDMEGFEQEEHGYESDIYAKEKRRRFQSIMSDFMQMMSDYGHTRDSGLAPHPGSERLQQGVSEKPKQTPSNILALDPALITKLDPKDPERLSLIAQISNGLLSAPPELIVELLTSTDMGMLQEAAGGKGGQALNDQIGSLEKQVKADVVPGVGLDKKQIAGIAQGVTEGIVKGQTQDPAKVALSGNLDQSQPAATTSSQQQQIKKAQQ